MNNIISGERLGATKYNTLCHVDDIKPINEDDVQCLKEVRDVLEKHGMLTRFGVTLLHKHFDLAEGEALVELTDEASRVQTVAPRPIIELSHSQVLQTQFSLETGDAIASCHLECVISNNSHSSKHVTFGG